MNLTILYDEDRNVSSVSVEKNGVILTEDIDDVDIEIGDWSIKMVNVVDVMDATLRFADTVVQ